MVANNQNQPKKILGIYFSKKEVLDYPFSMHFYFESYAEIIEKLAIQNIETVIVRADSYQGSGHFSPYDVWNGTTYERRNTVIHIDVLWNRDSENTIPAIDDCPIINSNDFDDLCRDKWRAYEVLGDICPQTVLLSSYEDVASALDTIETEKVVCKPRNGEQSKGVYVLQKDEVVEDLYTNWNDILLQSFLDSSNGVASLYEGSHEVDVNIVNGDFAGSRIKKFHPGVLVASATSGTSDMEYLTRDRIPEELWNVVEQVDTHLQQWTPRIYRADFMSTAGGYKLVEINSRPGVMHPEKEGDQYWDFNGRLVDLFVELLGNGVEKDMA